MPWSLFSPPALRQGPPPRPEVWNSSDPSFLLRLLRDETATKRIGNSQCPTANRHQLRSVGGLPASEQVSLSVYGGMGAPRGRGWRWAAAGPCLARRLTDLVLLLLCRRSVVIPSLRGPRRGGEGRPQHLTLFLGKLQGVCVPLGRDPVLGFIAGGWISPPTASSGPVFAAQAVELNRLVSGMQLPGTGPAALNKVLRNSVFQL